MQLLDKRINLNLKLEKVIGFAIGFDSWGKTNIRTRQYQLLILCFVIELQTRTSIKEEIVENSYTPHKRKNKTKKTFMAKLVGTLCFLSLIATVTGLYEALTAYTGADANALTMLSSLFAILFIVLGIFYIAMDPKDKYYA
tara:strand:+ start:56 stop:478 length:423 start_codon:yes stop_codon:yes gene_type:complete